MNKADLEKLGLTTEALEKAGLTADVLDKIIIAHGKDIESHKTKVTDLTTQLKTATDQLAEANTTIEGFKKLNPEQLQQAADEWKTKFETAQTEAKNQLAALKFDHALESALMGAKVKNVKTIVPLLSMDSLKDAKGELLTERLAEQLTKIKSENEYLFTDEKPTPKIVEGGNSQPVITDAFEAAMWKGAGLKPPEAKQ